ncbi:MAG: DUF1109 domain-containing protein [Proteobacteria bacterium]|nr:DUF1109 domain-containing protein [Pseudomonadota bacterium]
MDTEALIDQLVQNLQPAPPRAADRRIALGLLAGGLVTLALIVLTVGVNPALDQVIRHYTFWVKWAYALSLGVLALGLVRTLGRPDGRLHRSLWLFALPVVALAAIGVVEMAQVPPSHWRAMWLGQTWMVCPWLILALSTPLFIGLLWSFRRMAPTRLGLAGAAAGLASGALGAMLYCLHCPEMSAIFVLTWYTLGILMAAGIGALLGPRLLRW